MQLWRTFGPPKPQNLAEMKFWYFLDKRRSDKFGGILGEILVGHSAQQIKHENGQTTSPNSSPNSSPISLPNSSPNFLPGSNICRRNFALGNVRRKNLALHSGTLLDGSVRQK